MCIWRNVCFQGGTGTTNKPVQDDDEEEELENATEAHDNNSRVGDEEMDKDVEQVKDTRWHAKTSSFFEHVPRMSQKLCQCAATSAKQQCGQS